MVTKAMYANDYENHWCPGCGNFGILSAMKGAFVHLGLRPDQARTAKNIISQIIGMEILP